MVSNPAFAASGAAEISGTVKGSPVHGKVRLKEVNGGVNISVIIDHVPPGMHGFHIHEFGLCHAQGTAAGSHFNPMQVSHGLLLKQGFNRAHVGDLGNLNVSANRQATLNLFVPGLSLVSGTANANVAGRAFIVHEKPDDFSQPLGNAGGRIGCGIIVVTSK